MKVYIGPYPSRLISRLYDDYMNKKYDYKWPETQTSFERKLEWVDDKIQSFYNIFNWIWYDRRKQKIKIRIDPHDTWGMYDTLAHIILPMLKQLKATKHGTPYVDEVDVPANLAPTQFDEDTGLDDTHEARWEWVFNEIIWAFEQILDDTWESQYYKFSDNLDDPPIYADTEGHRKHQDRITNGLKLFGKYFQCLWD